MRIGDGVEHRLIRRSRKRGRPTELEGRRRFLIWPASAHRTSPSRGGLLRRKPCAGADCSRFGGCDRGSTDVQNALRQRGSCLLGCSGSERRLRILFKNKLNKASLALPPPVTP